jgi:hypothetical protein
MTRPRHSTQIRAQRHQVQAMKRGLSEGTEEPESTLMELSDGTLVDFSEAWSLPESNTESPKRQEN